MELNEILRLMIEYAQEVVLLDFIQELIAFLQQEDYQFLDLLQALSSYATRERRKDIVDNPAWETVSRYLTLSVAELAQSFGNVSKDLDKMPKDLRLTYMFAGYFHRSVLLEMVTLWTHSLEHQCRFSDLLLGLSSHAAIKSQKDPDNTETWQFVAGLIKSAAEEAERIGKELP